MDNIPDPQRPSSPSPVKQSRFMQLRSTVSNWIDGGQREAEIERQRVEKTKLMGQNTTLQTENTSLQTQNEHLRAKSDSTSKELSEMHGKHKTLQQEQQRSETNELITQGTSTVGFASGGMASLHQQKVDKVVADLKKVDPKQPGTMSTKAKRIQTGLKTGSLVPGVVDTALKLQQQNYPGAMGGLLQTLSSYGMTKVRTPQQFLANAAVFAVGTALQMAPIVMKKTSAKKTDGSN